MLTYTLIAGIDLLEAVRRYGLAGRSTTIARAYAASTSLPVVWRSSSARWASAARSKG